MKSSNRNGSSKSKVELHIGLMDLGELLREVALQINKQYQDRQVRLEGLSGAEIRGDRERLAGLLNCMVEVSHAYTPSGKPITLSLDLVEDGLVVEVHGEGCIIPTREQAHIFDLIYSGDAPPTPPDSVAHCLRFSREVVEGHGGKVWVSDAATGNETSFFFSLPFQEMSAPLAEFGEDHTPYSLPAALFTDAETQRPCALVVDDDRDVIALLKIALTGAGWSVMTARTGLEALQRVSERKPDVILLDATMPVMDARETIARLRLMEGLKAAEPLLIPVFIMGSDLTGPEQAREWGATGFINKPFDLDEVLRVVNEKKLKI